MAVREEKICTLAAAFLAFLVAVCRASAPMDIKMDEKAHSIHRVDTVNILVYTFLLILTVCIIWFFKRRRARFLHETGLAIIFGLIVGAIVRYASEETEMSHVRVVPIQGSNYSDAVPPDNVFVMLEVAKSEIGHKENKTYAYTFQGEVTDVESKKLNQKATFDPEIFFNIILPPIIFNAGYSLKRKFFFRNLGTIMTYAFVGTTISCFVVGVIMYAFLMFMPHLEFTFNNCLYFGAIISATDPVTVLAIFHDLHVDVNLYALVFGESILNDAVAIGLVSAISSYEENNNEGKEFEVAAAFKAFGNFVYIFLCSFMIGSVTGCVTALISKFTKLCDFPLLESCLFVLMSYTSFLIAEALDLTGIVAVLFCGICQAHYTYNNLSIESRLRTKQLFELLNFLAENFIFSYIGVSMFTYKKHRWDAGFIMVAFLAIAAGRALYIYPLTFLLNLGRTHKIPGSFQHVLFFSGLRGAMAFALAIRNTLSEQRHLMLTATSLIAIVTVIVCGGFTTQLLAWLSIPVGIEEEHEMLQFTGIRPAGQVQTPPELQSPPPQPETRTPYEKAWLVRKWYNFDVKFMKPLLTHSRPTLLDTLPQCCLPLAHVLTSTEQLMQEDARPRDDDSDTDLCLDESDFHLPERNSASFRGSLSRVNSALAPQVFVIEKPPSQQPVPAEARRADLPKAPQFFSSLSLGSL
ncbi:sodium/hydrogen exchanger 9 isoform X2 [Rhipicephalus sanguineus]|uniref:sodium/hydrogen exchanger 9 isoform X2 n=1 Tax=Rhipicephalus sanguineus TaxID=34632 RepID=UPI0020C52EE8|nr:sodium/hydrogen exchanger 9 isoform X2 [Rhipicephalus sanguineus]